MERALLRTLFDRPLRLRGWGAFSRDVLNNTMNILKASPAVLDARRNRNPSRKHPATPLRSKADRTNSAREGGL
jgi:hypothetical protein